MKQLLLLIVLLTILSQVSGKNYCMECRITLNNCQKRCDAQSVNDQQCKLDCKTESINCNNKCTTYYSCIEKLDLVKQECGILKKNAIQRVKEAKTMYPSIEESLTKKDEEKSMKMTNDQQRLIIAAQSWTKKYYQCQTKLSRLNCHKKPCFTAACKQIEDCKTNCSKKCDSKCAGNRKCLNSCKYEQNNCSKMCEDPCQTHSCKLRMKCHSKCVKENVTFQPNCTKVEIKKCYNTCPTSCNAECKAENNSVCLSTCSHKCTVKCSKQTKTVCTRKGDVVLSKCRGLCQVEFPKINLRTIIQKPSCVKSCDITTRKDMSLCESKNILTCPKTCNTKCSLNQPTCNEDCQKCSKKCLVECSKQQRNVCRAESAPKKKLCISHCPSEIAQPSQNDEDDDEEDERKETLQEEIEQCQEDVEELKEKEEEKDLTPEEDKKLDDLEDKCDDLKDTQREMQIQELNKKKKTGTITNQGVMKLFKLKDLKERSEVINVIKKQIKSTVDPVLASQLMKLKRERTTTLKAQVKKVEIKGLLLLKKKGKLGLLGVLKLKKKLTELSKLQCTPSKAKLERRKSLQSLKINQLVFIGKLSVETKKQRSECRATCKKNSLLKSANCYKKTNKCSPKCQKQCQKCGKDALCKSKCNSFCKTKCINFFKGVCSRINPNVCLTKCPGGVVVKIPKINRCQLNPCERKCRDSKNKQVTQCLSSKNEACPMKCQISCDKSKCKDVKCKTKCQNTCIKVCKTLKKRRCTLLLKSKTQECFQKCKPKGKDVKK